MISNLCPVCSNPKKHSVERPRQSSTWSKTCGSRICIKTLTQQTNIAVYGHVSNLHQILENGKTVLENTIQLKYGVENISQLAHVKEKKQDTCVKNFGVKWPMQSDIVKEKSIDTLLHKYGYDNISKVPSIIEKIKITQTEKYGALYVQTPEGKEMIKRSCQEKYGVDWYFQSDEFRKKLEDRCMEKYGVPNPFMSPSVQSEIAKRNSKGISVGETDWLNSLEIPLEYRQVPIKSISGKNYIVDGFDPITNTIYEYNGSFWHGNPDYYVSEDYHPIIKTVTFGELYEKTIQKQEDLLSSGYHLIIKWS